MEPAIAFALALATVLAALLTSDLVTVGVRHLTGTSWNQPFVRAAVTLICTAFIMLVAVRPPAAAAATPPPSVRIASSPAPGEEAPVEALSPEATRTRPHADRSTYTVVAGDSLWKIAKRHIESSGLRVDGTSITTLWKAVYELNRSVIGDDPNLIHPGQVLEIPGG